MRELCLACAGFVLEFIVFYAAGIVLARILKIKGDCSLTFILGYLVYFAVFELVIVPMTLKWVSLTAAAYIWAGIMALVICAAVICTIKKQRRIRAGQTETCSGIFGSISEIWKNHSVMIILAGAVVLLQCLIVIFYEDTTVDAAYYVGTVSTSVYTDTLGRYNPFNGAIQKAFQARYVFSAYPMHNAVWCRLLGIHPIVQAKQVMSCMNVVTANLIIYQIGKRLFDGNRKKADLMLVFVCVLQLFCGTIYSSGTFFFTRSYEGKAILANIAIPTVLMCAVWYLQEKNSRNVWIILFVTAVSALTFSGSAIIFPIVIAAGMAPAAVMNSDELAKEVDFFSIGTNDLTQYTLAIDRQNTKLEAFYDAHHPAVLRMIQKTIENGHKAGCWVGICGELGADMTLTETFLKMGIDELSVSPTFVLPIRKLIREMSTK